MMRSRIRMALPAALLLVLGLVTANPAASACVSTYINAPTAVRHAADQLSDYTAIPLGRPAEGERVVRIELDSATNPRIGTQGYTIHSQSDDEIVIEGNTATGAANGVYTLLRTLMIEHRKDPFSRKWAVEEKPAFTIRVMQVAPYRFGGSYGFAALSPDRWSFKEWKQYADFMRLCNMTTLCIVSARLYDPDYPHSWREKWRFQIWKQVMEYCHQVGMKFDWMIAPNMTTQQAFWDNPTLQTVVPNAWWGDTLVWSKAKDLILKNQSYTFKYFRALDGLEMIYADGGAYFDEPDPAATFADETRSYMKLLRKEGNDAKFLYWNWLMDFWAKVAVPPALLKKHPNWVNLQNDVLPLLPKNVGWVDASVLTLLQYFGKYLEALGNPPMPEGLLLGKEHGFRPIIDFFWYMNPETALNMFPHPSIQRGIQEARYARDEIGANGVEGYRLAPPCRFIGDYVYFRLASDPSLTKEQLVKELAGLLTERTQDEPQAEEAINTLERFWSTRKLTDIEKADKLFQGVLAEEPVHHRNLEYATDGLTFLKFIVRMAQPGVTEKQKAEMEQQLYQTVKPMYIFQGITADIVWQPEAIRFFNARVNMMVKDYQKYRAIPDVVNRSLYPKATARAVKFNFGKGLAAKQN